ncbi:Hydroperoxy fatty acid reductase gpx2 [compost metagenome]
MMSRISVRGSNAHPFYLALASAAGSTPKWNFYKYIIAPGGKSVIAFGPLTRPDDPAFLKALQQRLPAAP